jgi:hypothetical protein
LIYFHPDPLPLHDSHPILKVRTDHTPAETADQLAAAHLRLPVSLVVVIASDLVDTGHLQIRSAPRHTPPPAELLEKVLDGLRKL